MRIEATKICLRRVRGGIPVQSGVKGGFFMKIDGIKRA
jgi:hypothetical protein